MNNSTCLFKEEVLCNALVGLRRALGVISFVSAGFVLFLIFVLKRYVFFSQRLIFYLVGAALIDSFAYIFGSIELKEGPVCTIDGLYLSIGDWMVVVWVCIITINLFWSVVVLRRVNKLFEVFYICAGIIVPLIFAIIPLFKNNYGPAGVWCWIKNETTEEKVFRFVLWYIPIWLLILALFVIFVIIIAKLTWDLSRWDESNPLAQQNREHIRREIKPLILYPVVFLILNIFPTINRIQNVIDNDNPNFILYTLHTISSSLLAFGCTMVFVVNRETLKELKWSNFRTSLIARFSCKTSGKVIHYDASVTKSGEVNIEYSTNDNSIEVFK